jgi:ankyrin repeat protein
VKHQNEKLTKLLLDNYFDPNIVYPQKDISCLMIAAKDNNIPIVQMLIDQDVDVDYKTNKGGFDAKMIANHFGHRQIIQLLNK